MLIRYTLRSCHLVKPAFGQPGNATPLVLSPPMKAEREASVNAMFSLINGTNSFFSPRYSGLKYAGFQSLSSARKSVPRIGAQREALDSRSDRRRLGRNAYSSVSRVGSSGI